jgi:myo-inositol catabolism protein IolC
MGVHTTHRVNRRERRTRRELASAIVIATLAAAAKRGTPTWATAPEAIGVVGNWEKICPMSRPNAFLNMRRVWRMA